ncbi:MAG: hypothetical protein ISN64_00725 [Rickettsia sp.]|nr:hypothetical protein [Rickettsia sp.]
MVFPQGLADIEVNSIGQLIVVPKANVKEALFISFITDKKTVQDLSILFVDKKPEVVHILSKNSLKKDEVKNER